MVLGGAGQPGEEMHEEIREGQLADLSGKASALAWVSPCHH